MQFRPLPTHPRYMGSIVSIDGMFDHDQYYRSRNKRPTYEDILHDIKDGKVSGPKAEYVRDVARWCKKNPELMETWHRKLMEAARELK